MKLSVAISYTDTRILDEFNNATGILEPRVKYLC